MNIFEWISGLTVGMNRLEGAGVYISTTVGIVFTLMYLYQFFYIFVALIKRPLRYPATDQSKRYAVVIAARNEENVLPELLRSIAGQTYPADKIAVYVVADNCTDKTADAARAMGARVYERQNKELVGKGYALEYLFDHIRNETDRGFFAYDAYIVLDADNVLRKNYIEEMDKAYCAGNKVLTSYRNSKNYGKNWVSAGYALWFMRESRHLNNPRSILGTSAAISGTGFLVDSGIIDRNGGWAHFLLTEDIEFTADCILHGERVGYCHHAELFDEQPETFRQSWRQRKRWAKGFFQVFRNYGKGLFKGSLKLHWACYDMTMNILPAFILSTIQIISITGLLLADFIIHREISRALLECFGAFFLYGYCILFFVGIFALITEWRKIHCNKVKAVLLFFTFPLFMMTYIPISLSALFSHVEWQPIAHKYAMNTTEIEKQGLAPGTVLPKETEKGAGAQAREEEPVAAAVDSKVDSNSQN